MRGVVGSFLAFGEARGGLTITIPDSMCIDRRFASDGSGQNFHIVEKGNGFRRIGRGRVLGVADLFLACEAPAGGFTRNKPSHENVVLLPHEAKEQESLGLRSTWVRESWPV
jgi:hypothetical protein